MEVEEKRDKTVCSGETSPVLSVVQQTLNYPGLFFTEERVEVGQFYCDGTAEGKRC